MRLKVFFGFVLFLNKSFSRTGLKCDHFCHSTNEKICLTTLAELISMQLHQHESTPQRRVMRSSATMTSFPYFSNEGLQGRRHALAIKYRPQPHTAIFSMQGSTFKVARWPVTTTSLCRAYTDAGPNEPLQISSIIMMKSTRFFLVLF